MYFLGFGKLIQAFRSLRFQLLLYFLLVVVFVLTIGSALTYRNTLDILKKRNEQLVLQQFKQIEHDIWYMTDEVERLSKLFILEDNVQEFLQLDAYSSDYVNIELARKIQRKIDNIIMNYPYIDSVYLFTENREVLGESNESNIILRKSDKEHEFFLSSMYYNIDRSYPKTMWYGGAKKSFFNNMSVSESSRDSFLITSVKGVKAISNFNRTGIVAINIKEDYFSSIYRESIGGSDNYIYLLDSDGKLVSSSDNRKIGMVSPLFSKINNGEDFGSITYSEGQGSKQIVFYKLEKYGWYILREMPLELAADDGRLLSRTLVITVILSILVIFIVSYFWLKRITGPLNSLTGAIRKMGRGELGLTSSNIPRNELGYVVEQFNEMSLNISKLIKKNEDMQKEKIKIEMDVLQAQINPHFLYNTLNMIKWMATVLKADNITNSIVALGNILSPVFRSDEIMWTIKQELEYVDNYMKIMNWRFGNSIEFLFDTDDRLMDCKTPRFVLQPLVENSITHGMNDVKGQFRVRTIVREEAGDVVIKIADNGEGIAEEKLAMINDMLESDLIEKNEKPQGGIGLYNVQKRIRTYFGRNYGVSIQRIPGGGICAILRIPWSK